MDPATLKIVAQVAGVAGIALAVFLTVFRDVIRKQIFPMLTKQQAFRLLTLVLLLVWSVALAGIGAWVWISLDNKKMTEEHSNGPGHPESPDKELVGEWLVSIAGALPGAFTREMDKNPKTGEGSQRNERSDDMEKAIDDLTKSFGGVVKSASQPGSFVLRLNPDYTYKITEKSGIFQELASEQLAASGKWSFSGTDRRLILIGLGAGTAPSFTLKTIEKDRLVDDSFGGRMCVFERRL